MFDLIGLFAVITFTPIIIINGMKHYKISVDKSIKILIYILLGFELFRFFYTAQFYERAYMPADKVTFTFITFSVILALFAGFNKGRFGQVCKSILVFTALCPIIVALVYPHVYINELDTFALCKALYFAQTGLVISIAILLLKEEISKISVKALIFSLCFVLVYVFANAMRNIFWVSNVKFDLYWFICMGAIILSVIVVYFVCVLIAKRRIHDANV